LGRTDPWAMPASPPMITNSTSCSRRVERICFGRNSGRIGGAEVALHEVRKRRAMLDALRRSHRERPLVERPVVPVIDLACIKYQLLVHEVEQPGECLDGGGDEAPLDPRDRGLTRARPGGKLLLREAVALARFADELSCVHAPKYILSDVFYCSSA